MLTRLEREEDALTEEYNNGDMSLSEYNQAMQELHREYRAYAEEAAQEAYDREMERVMK